MDKNIPFVSVDYSEILQTGPLKPHFNQSHMCRTTTGKGEEKKTHTHTYTKGTERGRSWKSVKLIKSGTWAAAWSLETTEHVLSTFQKGAKMNRGPEGVFVKETSDRHWGYKRHSWHISTPTNKQRADVFTLLFVMASLTEPARQTFPALCVLMASVQPHTYVSHIPTLVLSSHWSSVHFLLWVSQETVLTCGQSAITLFFMWTRFQYLPLCFFAKRKNTRGWLHSFKASQTFTST